MSLLCLKQLSSNSFGCSGMKAPSWPGSTCRPAYPHLLLTSIPYWTTYSSSKIPAPLPQASLHPSAWNPIPHHSYAPGQILQLILQGFSLAPPPPGSPPWRLFPRLRPLGQPAPLLRLQLCCLQRWNRGAWEDSGPLKARPRAYTPFSSP